MTMEPIRVLYFVDRLLRGGIQSFIVDYITHMDPAAVRVELLTLDDGQHYELEDVLREKGVTIHQLKGIWLRKPADVFSYRRALDAFFRDHPDYDIVHLHSSSKNVFVLTAARNYGIPVRIAHSHSTNFQSRSLSDRLLGNLLKYPLRRAATHYFACSAAAGEWLFGRRHAAKGRVTVIPNAIDAARFRYDPQVRAQVRAELGLNDALVVGNVGRFTSEKNHCFLIKLFDELHIQRPDSVLLLVGEGPLRKELETMVRERGLTEQVRFLGYREDRERYLQAMDLFACPSLFEGLGIVLIEAQAAGLPCVASKDVIPTEVQITDRFQFVSVRETSRGWAESILAMCGGNRKDQYSQIVHAGYDIHAAAYKLQSMYGLMISQ